MDADDIINQDTVMPAPEMGAWENKPVVLEGVVRETDPLPEIFLPATGVTRNRKSQYHSKASHQTPEHKPSGVSRKVRAALGSFSVDGFFLLAASQTVLVFLSLLKIGRGLVDDPPPLFMSI